MYLNWDPILFSLDDHDSVKVGLCSIEEGVLDVDHATPLTLLLVCAQSQGLVQTVWDELERSKVTVYTETNDIFLL